MSFRWFIYYCATCGGCAAYIGWALGRLAGVESPVFQAATKGLFLGLAVALALGLIDAIWNSASARLFPVGQRVMVAVASGCLGGFVGGFLGQVLYGATGWVPFLLLGWTMTGALVGAAPGLFDYLASLSKDEDSTGPKRKVLRGVLGGSLGGLLGALLFVFLQNRWDAFFGEQPISLWSPSATGFVALGLCIGLLIGLAQVILREGWLRVEAGFRPGRELLLSTAETTIGRAETCHLGLFGDTGVERLHARIVREGNRYVLIDLETSGGTFVNGERVEKVVLTSGDEIRLGRQVLRFGERKKAPAEDQG